MVSTNPHIIEKNYDQMSTWYSFSESWFEKYFVNLGIKLLNIQPEDNILILGPGTGSSVLHIADHLNTGNVTAIDISSNMLQQINQKLQKPKYEHLRYRITLIHGNYLDVEFGKFDKIFLSFTIEILNLREMRFLLEKIQNTLSSSGKIVFVSLYDTNSAMVRIYNYFQQLYPEVIDCKPIPLKTILHESNYRIGRSRLLSMWGIPVIILEAFLN